MEIKLFNVKDRKAFPTDHCYTIGALKKLMDLFPDYYIDVYTYIQYMTSLDGEKNPYVNVDESIKAETIIKDVNPKIDPLDENIKAAVKVVYDLYRSNIHYRSFMAKKINFENYLRFVENEEWSSGKDGSASSLIAANKAFQEMKAAYDTAEADYTKNVLNKKTWAGQKDTHNPAELKDEE